MMIRIAKKIIYLFDHIFKTFVQFETLLDFAT